MGQEKDRTEGRINREDMLELTRRMTPARNCIFRVAGCYMDRDGEEDGSFNVHFRKLSGAELKKNLEIAKTIPFAETNVQLKEYAFAGGEGRKKSLWPLLTAIRESALKDDALLSILYELIAENYEGGGPYAVYVFFGIYDIPKRGTDREWLEGSEEIYDFLILAIGPYSGDYEVGMPEFGFLFPAFSDRSGDRERVDIYRADPEIKEERLMRLILGKEGTDR